MTQKDKWSRIPLIIKRAGQDKHRDFNSPVEVVYLIKRLIIEKYDYASYAVKEKRKEEE